MFWKNQVRVSLLVLISTLVGSIALVGGTKAEETYKAYHVKVKYCPPPDLESYVGDTHDNGCTGNLNAFTVWAA